MTSDTTPTEREPRTMPTPTTPASGNFVIGSVTLVFLFTALAAVTVIVMVEDGDRASSIVGMLLPIGGTSILALLALFKLGDVAQVAEEVRGHTLDLTNGKMDAKIRANLADILGDEYIDPKALGMIEQAREIRDRGNVEAHRSMRRIDGTDDA